MIGDLFLLKWMKTISKPWNDRPKVRTWTSLKMYGWKLKLSCRNSRF